MIEDQTYSGPVCVGVLVLPIRFDPLVYDYLPPDDFPPFRNGRPSLAPTPVRTYKTCADIDGRWADAEYIDNRAAFYQAVIRLNTLNESDAEIERPFLPSFHAKDRRASLLIALPISLAAAMFGFDPDEFAAPVEAES